MTMTRDEQIRCLVGHALNDHGLDNFEQNRSVGNHILANLKQGGFLADDFEPLNELRRDEGSSVTLLCDNPDFNGQPNNAVVCNGAWTNWEDRRFTGDTIGHAIRAALDAYRKPTS